MHGKGIMQYLKGVGQLLLLGLALVWPALSTTTLAADLTGSARPLSPGTIDRFLSLSLSEAGAQAAADEIASAPADAYLVAYAPMGEGKEQTPELEDFVRHRNFTKFFLVVILCGAIIRFFTSPTFETFAMDVLDPKAW